MSISPSGAQPAADDNVLRLLTEGRVQVIGRIPSSNLTLLVEVRTDDDCVAAVYKPKLGERPLLDFEPGLHRREAAAYLLSEVLGWGLVPPTVVRADGPAGVGSLQLFIAADLEQHYFTLDLRKPQVADALRRLAVFDIVANNADRKSGHVLRDADGRIWAIDHGLCFAASFKLRTVIWDFADEPIPQRLLAQIAPLAARVPTALAEALEPPEAESLQARVRHLLDTGRFPVDDTGRRVPWPLV